MPDVIFEDKHLVCVRKPYNVLSQGNERTKSLCDDISDYLKSKGDSGDVFVLHRLDKTTSGVIVYAKTKLMAAKMSKLIANGDFIKTYLCVVTNPPFESSGHLVDLLYHDKVKNKTYVVKRERKGVKKAELYYETIKTSEYKGESVSLIKVRLLTGRTHQIRVQFASRRHPLVGDKKYGSNLQNDTIALFCTKIEFIHPITDEKLSLNAQPDTDVFKIFE